jgi:hypothetical protein
MELDHPDLAHDGGEVLHGKVASIYTKIGDAINSRFFTKDALANSGSQDFDHNFNCSFEDLNIHLYLRNTGTGELTKLSEDSSPKRSEFSIVAKTGNEKTHITVTNNSGSARDIAVVLEQGKVARSAPGLQWNAPAGSAPTIAEENGQEVWLFESGASLKAVLFVKVPKNYIQGNQIKLFIAQYSPSSSNTQLLQSTTYLVRRNTDAMSATGNSQVSGNSALTNTVANQYREAELALTDSSGKINSVSVKPSDLLKVELVRGTDTDTADIRFVPSSTEIYFN